MSTQQTRQISLLNHGQIHEMQLITLDLGGLLVLKASTWECRKTSGRYMITSFQHHIFGDSVEESAMTKMEDCGWQSSSTYQRHEQSPWLLMSP